MQLLRKTIAKKALADFLKQSVDDISCDLLTGGSDETAIVRCTHLTTNYVVKFFNTNEFGNNEIAWTQHASDLDIGPMLYYADPAGSYMIIDFAKGTSLVPATANTPAIIKNIATSLAKLHHSSAPFSHTSDIFTRIDAKYKKLHCSNMLKNILENGMQHVTMIKKQLQSLNISPVPCHNDLNPGNIFTSNNQVTLIDWGDAALGNPYYDIAAFFVLNIIEPKNEKLFFEKYDVNLLNPQWQNDIQLYEQLVCFEFALNLLLGVQASESELLHAQQIVPVNNLNYYLTLLAEQEVKINSDFLYNMAIASLHRMFLTYTEQP